MESKIILLYFHNFRELALNAALELLVALLKFNPLVFREVLVDTAMDIEDIQVNLK